MRSVVAGKNVLERGKRPAQIVAWMLDGKGDAEVVALLRKTKRLAVSPQAVAKFRKRHESDLVRVVEAVREEIQDLAIAEKAERIRRLDWIWRLLGEIVEERQQRGQLGGKAVERRWIGGEWGREIEIERTDAALIAQLRGVLDDVAAEQGERVKVKIDNRKQIITLEALQAILEGE